MQVRSRYDVRHRIPLALFHSMPAALAANRIEQHTQMNRTQQGDKWSASTRAHSRDGYLTMKTLAPQHGPYPGINREVFHSNPNFILPKGRQRFRGNIKTVRCRGLLWSFFKDDSSVGQCHRIFNFQLDDLGVWLV